MQPASSLLGRALLLALLAWLPLTAPCRDRGVEAARRVMERAARSRELPVDLSIRPDRQAETYFDYAVRDGRLRIEASDPVALCRGFYDYVKQCGAGLYSWTGDNIVFPRPAADTAPHRVVSPFAHHYYFNVVTYGYTMPYWDWERWEREIDWMALHGYDMPLALAGYEAILARVLRGVGLTDEQIGAYFAGPAHLPWMRMGNLCSIDGPLDEEWHRDQVALQHRILDRMRELGMKPIAPGFAGFVPECIAQLYPGAELIETEWGGAFRNWMLSPQDPLFAEIGTRFIREWEREFGRCDYYLVDSFNELDIPFPEKGDPERYEMAATYGERVYDCIRRANPRAVWVMQGWMFGYQRDMWDRETLQALVSRVPDERMMLLDLAVDYTRLFWKTEPNWEYYPAFFGKQWVYSVIPNMGGKTGPTGLLDFYANGHLDALASPSRGRLVAHGAAPEGIENNEVIYELLSDAGWSDRPIDLDAWLRRYSENRYGACPETIVRYWELMRRSVYGSFTDHPRFNWQFRPGTVRQGTVRLCDDFFRAVEAFAEAADELGGSPLYRADLAELAALYLGGKAELLVGAIEWQYELGDRDRAAELEKSFERLLRGIDALLAGHPTLRLDRWIDFARRQARTPDQERRYERNARRIVTVWGPPVDDYSARVWSGLAGDYYLPRWQHRFESLRSGRPFDYAAWELAWVERRGLPAVAPPADPIAAVRELFDGCAFVTPDLSPRGRENELGAWRVAGGETQTFRFVLDAARLRSLAGLRFELDEGSAEALSMELTADGALVASHGELGPLSDGRGSAACPVALPEGVRANNGAELRVTVTAAGGEECAGCVVLVGRGQ